MLRDLLSRVSELLADRPPMRPPEGAKIVTYEQTWRGQVTGSARRADDRCRMCRARLGQAHRPGCVYAR